MCLEKLQFLLGFWLQRIAEKPSLLPGAGPLNGNISPARVYKKGGKKSGIKGSILDRHTPLETPVPLLQKMTEKK